MVHDPLRWTLRTVDADRWDLRLEEAGETVFATSFEGDRRLGRIAR